MRWRTGLYKDRASALGTKLRSFRKLLPTTGTDAYQRSCAFLAEFCSRWILVLAARALHAGVFTRVRRTQKLAVVMISPAKRYDM